jgi:hypothetical protein
MFRSTFAPGTATAPTSDDDSGQLLAPELYRALVRVFGQVRVRKRGERADFRPMQSAGGIRSHQHSPGEIYAFNCPFCGDRKFRGWVGYMYGQPDPVTGYPLKRMVGCWNEGCFKDPGRYSDFELTLIGALPSFRNGQMPAPNGHGHVVRRGPAAPPGTIIPLSELGDRHQARRYIVGRGFDPDELSIQYGVGYCIDADPDYSFALNRLYIPVTYQHHLVGWQARVLHDESKRPYCNMTGFSTGDYFYNFDRASQGRCVVLVEGVFDAWSVGPEAMALFGKVIGHGKQEKLRSLIPREPIVVLMIDPKEGEAWTDAEAILRPMFPGRVLSVKLPMAATEAECRRWPPGKQIDAGVLQQDVIWAAIFEAGDSAGINLQDYI